MALVKTSLHGPKLKMLLIDGVDSILSIELNCIIQLKYRLPYRCAGFARLRLSRYLVTAPSHCSCELLLKATRGVTIAVVSSR